MTQRHALMTTKTIAEGPLEPDYALLRVISDDTGTILEITPERFREADARTIEIRQGWTDLAQTTLDEFRAYVEANFGAAYMLVLEGAAA